MFQNFYRNINIIGFSGGILKALRQTIRVVLPLADTFHQVVSATGKSGFGCLVPTTMTGIRMRPMLVLTFCFPIGKREDERANARLNLA